MLLVEAHGQDKKLLTSMSLVEYYIAKQFLQYPPKQNVKVEETIVLTHTPYLLLELLSNH